MAKNIRKFAITIGYAYRLPRKHLQIQFFWVFSATDTNFERVYQKITEKLETLC